MGPLVLSAIGTITGIIVGAVLTFALARQTGRTAAKKEDVDKTRDLLEQRVNELRAERDKADAKVAGLEVELRSSSDDCKAQIAAQDARIATLETDVLAKVATFEGALAAMKAKDVEIAALTARNIVLVDRQADLLFEARMKAAQAPAPATTATAPVSAPAVVPAPIPLTDPPVVLKVTTEVLDAAPGTPLMVLKDPVGERSEVVKKPASDEGTAR